MSSPSRGVLMRGCRLSHLFYREAMLPTLFVAGMLSTHLPTTLRRIRTAPAMKATRVVIPFKGVRLEDAVSLIHSPERWASGAGLMSGIDPFLYYGVSGPFVCGPERMLTFRALGHCVRLMGYRRRQATVTITAPNGEVPHTRVSATVWGTGGTGVTLALRIESQLDIDAVLLASAIRVGLFGCADIDFPENEAMRSYRSGLVETPI